MLNVLTHAIAFGTGVALTLTVAMSDPDRAPVEEAVCTPIVQMIAPPVVEEVEMISRLEAAIWMKESSGRDGWILGDNDNALGPLQIWRSAWTDALQHDPSIGGSYEDCANIEYALKIFRAYMDRYCVPHRIGDMPYDEAAARIWNGGPRGHRKNATIAYWHAVENFRDDPALFDIMP
jgi:hypothetical protein